jgi:hypothetical protein
MTQPSRFLDPNVQAPLSLFACEFIGSVIDENLEDRRCSDGTFCAKRLFDNPAIYASCPTRLEKLKTKKDQP